MHTLPWGNREGRDHLQYLPHPHKGREGRLWVLAVGLGWVGWIYNNIEGGRWRTKRSA